MNNRFNKLVELLALEGIVARLRTTEVPGDALTWTRFFGSLLLVLLVLLFLSGSFMAFNYTPAPGSAYDSVDFALFSLPFGDVIKGIHYYSWNLLFIVMGLHLIRAFILGAYKSPRQLVWVSGLLILITLPLFIITGDLLPWDQKGYWSTQVRLSVIASTPVIGNFIVRLLQGGPITGIVALTRFYVLHIIFLPGLLVVLIAMHFHFIGHKGLSAPLNEDTKPRSKVYLLPNMINRWIFLFLVVTLILGFVSWYWPAPLGDPADPTDYTYIPEPEWWVLFLNQLVTIFSGPLTIIGSIIIPGGLVGFMIALPFLDRSPERHPSKRWKIMIIGAVIAMALLVLSVMGYLEHFGSSYH